VPVGELLDVVDATARTPGAARRATPSSSATRCSRSTATTSPGALVPGRPGASTGHARGRPRPGRRRAEPRPFLAGPLPAEPRSLIEVEDLVRFVERPVRAFLRQRLGITVGTYEHEVADALPVELDGLEQWGVGDRLLQARLAGTDHRVAVTREVARGRLPPGLLGKPVVEGVLPAVEDIVERAARAGPATGRSPGRSTSASRSRTAGA
jgi:exodeoxyribonuclease V gamma subunit